MKIQQRLIEIKEKVVMHCHFILPAFSKLSLPAAIILFIRYASFDQDSIRPPSFCGSGT
jgi:hypothetical protein